VRAGRLGALRLSTLIWWRTIRISASRRALNRNNPTSAPQSSLKKSIIAHDHRPISPLRASCLRFPTGQPAKFTPGQWRSTSCLACLGFRRSATATAEVGNCVVVSTESLEDLSTGIEGARR